MKIHCFLYSPRSIWRLPGSLSLTLKKTVPWTTSACSSTWPTTLRMSHGAILLFHLSMFFLKMVLFLARRQHWAYHHTSFSPDLGRVPGLSVWEARARHPHWYELLRRGAPGGQSPRCIYPHSKWSSTLCIYLLLWRSYARCLQPERRSPAGGVSRVTCTQI